MPPVAIVITSEPEKVILVFVSASPAMLSNCILPTLVMLLSLKDVAPKDIVPVAVKLLEPISILPKPLEIAPVSSVHIVVTLDRVSSADSK